MKHLKPVLITAASLSGVVGTLVLNPSAPELAVSATGGTGTEETVSPPPTSRSSDDANTQAAAATGSYTGDVYDTPYGPVQVQATVTDGTIADITFLQLPQENRSARINSAAASALVEEALTTQSAQVHAISGATWTVEGFNASLQSALDEAGL